MKKPLFIVLLVAAIGVILLMATDSFPFGSQQIDGQAPQTPQSFYPPSEDFKRAVESALDEVLLDRVFDAVWKKTFHYFTTFESIDGFSTSGATVTLTEIQLELITGAVSTNFANVKKEPDLLAQTTFSQPSRFRTTFEIPQVTAQTIYLTIGHVASGAQGYGFKIVNNVVESVYCADCLASFPLWSGLYNRSFTTSR